MLPIVQPVATGKYAWHVVEKTLTEPAQVNLLERELRALDNDLGRVVLDLRVRGVLSLAGRKAFEDRILQSVGAALRGLRFDEGGLVLEPSDADLDEIDHGGFVRVAADRLKAMAGDATNPKQAQLAALALRRLYVEHLRQGA
jgi:hypothetical protein